MKKYFVSFTQAVALKELGFDENCFATFDSDKWFEVQDFAQNYDTFPSHIIAAPLKAQVFEWFREKHKIGHDILCPFISFQGKDGKLHGENAKFEMYITDEEQLSITDEEFYHNSYEEAESAAIDKLIELLK